MARIRLADPAPELPVTSYRYLVEFAIDQRDDLVSVGFDLVSGLGFEVDLLFWDELVAQKTRRVLSGGQKPPERVTFRRAVYPGGEEKQAILRDWIFSNTDHAELDFYKTGARRSRGDNRADIQITAMRRSGEPGYSVNLLRCLPSEMRFSELRGLTSEPWRIDFSVAPEAMTVE